MRVPEELTELIRDEAYFVIASHINPEPDALGSSIALALALKSMGKEVEVYNRDGVGAMYNFLPGYDIVRTTLDTGRLKDAVFLILDCNELKRVGLEEISCRRIAVVDHHRTAGSYGDVRWVEPESPATGLMVYYLLKELGVRIEHEIAVNIYAAIAVDTGTFRYDNTTAETLRVAADLIDNGVNPGLIARELYDSWSINRLNLLVSMLNTLEFRNVEGKATVSISAITGEMFSQTGTEAADTEDFASFARMIKSVGISAMYREIKPGHWKASLRSKGDLDVSAVASHFGGGGHRNAAGYLADGDIEDIKRNLLSAVRNLS